jgi:hypothetical protein
MNETSREASGHPTEEPEENENGRDQDREAIRGEQGTSEGNPQNDADPVDPG